MASILNTFTAEELITGAVLAAVFGSMAWLYRTQSEAVETTSRNAPGLLLRLVAVLGPVHALVALLPYPAWTVYLGAFVVLALGVAGVPGPNLVALFVHILGAHVAAWITGVPIAESEPPSDSIPEPEEPHDPFAQYFGMRGTATKPMVPTGKVRVQGEQLPAKCESESVDAGQHVEIVGSDAFGVIVRPVESESD